MSDYTPTTEEVRFRFVRDQLSGEFSDEDVVRFDRWLAEVKAQAWDEAYGVALSDMSEGNGVTFNRYRQGEDNE